MKKLNKNQRKKLLSNDSVAMSVIEYDVSEDEKILKKIDKLSNIKYDLGHIYGSW